MRGCFVHKLFIGTWVPGRYTEVAFIQGWPLKGWFHCTNYKEGKSPYELFLTLIKSTGIFFGPVFAHVPKMGKWPVPNLITKTQVSEPTTSGLPLVSVRSFASLPKSSCTMNLTDPGWRANYPHPPKHSPVQCNYLLARSSRIVQWRSCFQPIESLLWICLDPYTQVHIRSGTKWEGCDNDNDRCTHL